NVRAEVAFNPESELLPVARANGVLTALCAPQGGVLSGTSALMMLDGWSGRDMTLAAPVAMHLQWPGMNIVRAWNVHTSEDEQIRNRDRALRQIQSMFDDARAYLTARRARGAGSPLHRNDQRWEAMPPVLEARIP